MPVNKFIKELGTELTETGLAYYQKSTRKFTYANEQFLDIFALDKVQLNEDPAILLKLLQPEDLDYLKNEYEDFSKGGHFKNVELRLAFTPGLIKQISCDVILLEESNSLLLFVRDITNRKFREDFLVNTAAQKDTLLDMLTHNLHGPLFLSKDILALLKKGILENTSRDISKMINLVQENTQQCIDIVNDYLQKEHFESMRVVPTISRFDAIEKINIVLDKLRQMNDKKHLSLNTEFRTLTVNSDSVKFFQILHNVLSNAVKYTDTDGKIEIKLSVEEKTFTVEVHDDGLGISDEIKPLIFNKRVSGNAGIRGEKSSGLGLSIAKKLVDMLEGEIWFTSTQKKGTTFFIRLPK